MNEQTNYIETKLCQRADSKLHDEIDRAFKVVQSFIETVGYDRLVPEQKDNNFALIEDLKDAILRKNLAVWRRRELDEFLNKVDRLEDSVEALRNSIT